ncbi:MAG: zinc ribbon domain-containing protein [Armatimonadota bacterium]
MFCSECGERVPDDARFCPKCGHELRPAGEAPEKEASDEAESAEAAPAEPPYQPTIPVEEEEETQPAQEPAQPPAADTQQMPPSAGIPTPTPQPTPSQPQAERPGAPEEAEEPPQAQPPPPQPPPGPQPPAEEPKKKSSATCWIVGCIVVLVLLILGGVGLWLFGRWAIQEAEKQSQQTTENQVEIWEPGEEGPSGGEGTEIGEIMRGLEEGLEEAREAVAGASVEGFDPGSVEASLLPTFYGFMAALAADDPDAMELLMSPSMKEQWATVEWEQAPHLEHRGFSKDDQRQVDEAEYRFVIEESLFDTEEEQQIQITWDIRFVKIDGKWYVDHLEAEQ